jgi:hypothetical protein
VDDDVGVSGHGPGIGCRAVQDGGCKLARECIGKFRESSVDRVRTGSDVVPGLWDGTKDIIIYPYYPLFLLLYLLYYYLITVTLFFMVA